MKITQKTIAIGCVIAIIGLIIGKMDLFWFSPDESYGFSSYTFTGNKKDSLEKEIRNVEQRLDSIKREKKIYVSGFEWYSGYRNQFIGLIKPEWPNQPIKKNDAQEYLVLSKIGLKIQNTHGPNYLAFYTRDNRSYLSRTKLVIKGRAETVFYVDQKVNYAYDPENNSILLPVDSTFWKMCIYFFGWGIQVPLLALFLFILFTFFKFIISISKNRIFEAGNIQRLKDLSIALLILGTHTYVLQLILYLIFSINHPTDGVTITHSFWEWDYFVLILSTICYLIYIAFKKGMLLQQEQELTI